MKVHQPCSLGLAIFCTCFSLHISKAIEILRPRGVSISKASLYNADADFTCLDGMLTIPFSYVNDDYCDCADGSDEPGTPACPNGTFHCTNAGHQPLDIPSSRINDGICDCCDASDEFGGISQHSKGGTPCSNTCHEMGRAAREEAQRKAELVRTGSELRLAMARRGKELQGERGERLAQLKRDRDEAEALKAEREVVKTTAEERENGALAKYREAEEIERQLRAEEERANSEQEALEFFKILDSDADGRVNTAEVQVRQIFDQNKDGEVSLDEAKFFLGQNEAVGEDEFLKDCWPRMRPLYMMEMGMYTPTLPDEDVQPAESADERVEKPDDAEEGEVEREEQEEEETDEDDGEDDAEELAQTPQDDGKQEEGVQYDEETQQIVEEAKQARADFEDADRVVRDIQRDVRQVEEALEKDYGQDQEFAPLDGECFEYTDREYVYKLCPFDQVSQRPKLGGAETRLGAWGQWSGPDHDKYASMMYDRGQGCWNGPQRSTNVVVSCGTENQVISVSEPNRCEYKFEFTTPAACRPTESGGEERSHDEL